MAQIAHASCDVPQFFPVHVCVRASLVFIAVVAQPDVPLASTGDNKKRNKAAPEGTTGGPTCRGSSAGSLTLLRPCWALACLMLMRPLRCQQTPMNPSASWVRDGTSLLGVAASPPRRLGVQLYLRGWAQLSAEVSQAGLEG